VTPRRVLCLLLALGLGTPTAEATTWGGKRIDDPIDGEACEVAEPASFGSYIYQWPEKYDQVFFPLTQPQGWWRCGSGYVSLIGDTTLSAEERQAIAAYLAALPSDQRAADAPADFLRRAEAIYALRTTGAERRCLLHRALAFAFETMAGEPDVAQRHRQAALDIMLERLAQPDLAPGQVLEYLFVSSNYLREQGITERADRLLAQLQKEIGALPQDDPLADYAGYLRGLLDDARQIAPGGRLALEP